MPGIPHFVATSHCSVQMVHKSRSYSDLIKHSSSTHKSTLYSNIFYHLSCQPHMSLKSTRSFCLYMHIPCIFPWLFILKLQLIFPSFSPKSPFFSNEYDWFRCTQNTKKILTNYEFAIKKRARVIFVFRNRCNIDFFVCST